MCGIHFVINANNGTSPHALDKFMHDCFLANQVRGTDSSGMFQVKNYKNASGLPEVSFHKSAASGSDFVADHTVKPLFSAIKTSRASIGHVRAATQGAVTGANAHPFTVRRDDGSRLIGVHNGTLIGWRGKEGADDHAVDSEWLLNRLAEDGAGAFEGFDGAWALVWYDSRHPDTLFVARNEKRPLFYAISEDGKAMIAASELGMLGWLADRNDIKLRKNDKGLSFFYPPAGNIMEVNMKTLETKFYLYAEYKAGKYAKPAVAAAPVRNTYTAPVSNYTSFNWQDSVLDRVKDALKLGRTRAEAPEEGEEEPPFQLDGGPTSTRGQSDEAGFEAAVKAELARFTSQGSTGIPEEEGPASFFTEVTSSNGESLGYIERPEARRAASAEERRRAKEKGMFGVIVNFTGYWFDNDDKCVYGDASFKVNGMEENFECIVRGQSQASGEAKYVSKDMDKTTKMVIVGTTPPQKFNNKRPYYILAEILADDKIRPFETSELRVVH